MKSQKTLLILSLASVSTISSNCTSPVSPPKQEGSIVQAITSGSLEQVKRLMAQDQIDVNNPLEIYMGNRKASYMPLHLAAMYRHAHLLVHFLDEGAAIEAKTAGSGQTALHLAAERGFREVVQVLLVRDADTHAKTKNGQTALDLAKAKDHAAIVAILEARAHGEKVGPKSIESSPNSGQERSSKGPSANLSGPAEDDKGSSASLGGQAGGDRDSSTKEEDNQGPSANLGKKGDNQGPSANLGKKE